MKLNKLFIFVVINILWITNVYGSFGDVQDINTTSSTLSVDKTEVPADGASVATVTLHLYNDEYHLSEHNIEDAFNVYLHTTNSLPSDVVISDVDTSQKDQGLYIFTIKSNIVESVSLTAHAKENHPTPAGGSEENSIGEINVNFVPPLP